MNSENKEVFDKCNGDSDEVIDVNKDIESVMTKVKAAWNDLKYTDSPSAKTVIMLSKREVASILYSVEEAKSIAKSIHEAAADIDEDQEYKDACSDGYR